MRRIGRLASGPVSPPAAVAECLGSLKGDTCTYEDVVAVRNNSRIHKARWGLRTIAVKECFGGTQMLPDPVAAEREFTALTSLAEANPASGAQSLVPLPLALCRDHAVYAMTWAAGRPATEVILSRTTTLDQACTLGKSAGHWLRRLHALRPLQARRSDYATKAQFVEQLFVAERRHDPLIRRAVENLVGQAAEAAASQLPASWIHGDMKSDNLLVDDGCITGLDVQLIHENTVAYDLSPFLNHLCLLRWTPLGFWQRHKLDLVAEAFLSAYSSETAGWKLPIIWLRSYLLIQLLDPFRKAGSLRALGLRWPARHELARAIDDLESGR